MDRKKFIYYTHSDKGSMYEQGEELGIDPESDAMDRFKYVGYEIPINAEVDLLTGETWATGINGVQLEKPVKI